MLRTLGPLLPVTAEGIDAWYENQRTDEHSVCFTLYERATIRIVIMDCLATEFDSPLLRARLTDRTPGRRD